MATMDDAMAVPEFVYGGIPEDATPEEALYLRAQIVIQAAFYALGDREHLPGTATLDRDELTDVLGCALAMMVAADKRAKNSRDIRLVSEATAKSVQRYAIALREAGDDVVNQLLAAMGVWSSPVN